MGLFTFVCRNLGGSWTAKQQERDLESSASSIAKEDIGVSEEEAAAAEDIVGGIPIVLTDRSTEDPGFVFVCRNGGEEDLEASASSIAKEDNEENKISEEAAAYDIVGSIPIVLTDRSTKQPGVVFVLEKASLEVVKIGNTYQLLNSDDHARSLRKYNRNPADYRPDITHMALLSILDSPVNRAGRLKAVYVKTVKGVLFEVNPHVLIPRTFKRFAQIILQLPQTENGKRLQLPQKLSSITADGNPEKLLRCIKNPVEKYLPVNSRKIGLSHSSEKLVNMQKHLSTVCNDTDTVFVLGAMANGKIECDYIDDFVSISGYRLSASCCASRICEALSTNWNII